MADGVFGGAGGGLLFSVVYEALKELTIKYMLFKHVLKKVKSTLKSLENVTEDIAKLIDDLDQSREAIDGVRSQLEYGKELIAKCRKISMWRVDRIYRSSNELLAWNEDLKEMLEMLKVFALRDVKETLVTVKGTESTAIKIESRTIVIQEGVEDLQTNAEDLKVSVSRVEGKLSKIEAAVMMQPQKEVKIEAWAEVPDLPSPIVVGLESPLDELKMMIFNAEVSKVVLTAPGGCGKTTLASKFCRDQKVQDKFKNNIFFVSVSQTPDFCLIVQELYKSKGNHVPTFKGDDNAVKWLQTFMKEHGRDPLLLVLDDVWSGSEYLLDKFDFKMPDHKVLVTSRSELPGFGSPYHLQPLDFDDAMTLFHHEASLADKSSYITADIAKQVVEGCKGFPLAITVIAKSLCGRPLEYWQKRLAQWSKGSSIFESESELLRRLQTSLDDLSVDVKECFLDLVSFPEDKRIPVDALIDIWIKSPDEDYLCVANVLEITNRSLASLVVTRKDKLQGDRYYTEHSVTQHDLLRELAMYVSKIEDTEQKKRLIISISKDNFPDWWTEQKYQCKARLLSISTDGEFSSNWPDMELSGTEVLVLNFQTKNYALPPFVEKLEKMKVVVLTNYGIVPSELKNFQLLSSSSNPKRLRIMRLERISIPSIAEHPINFSSLQKISLFMCNIGQAFSNGSIQLLHAWPKLEEMNIDYCNDLVTLPADITDLIHLKKLSITNSHKLMALPQDIGKLTRLELLRLRSCTSLEGLPDSIENLKKLNFIDISSCYSIKELPESFGELSSLRKLNMGDCSRLRELPLSVTNLENLQVIGDDDTQSLWELYLPMMRGTYITLAKRNVNLDWLYKNQS